MSISGRVLGGMGKDNALLVVVDGGRTCARLLFDCGEGCLAELAGEKIRAIDHLFFSHLHLDHVAGFDGFFRRTFDRTRPPNHVWGPPDTARILQHRFQGFLWNLHHGLDASWRVHEVHPGEVRTRRFELREAFAFERDEGSRPCGPTILTGDGFTVDAVALDHGTTVLGYVVRDRVGEGIAYLADCLLDEAALTLLATALRGCRTVVCAAPYGQADLATACRTGHQTAAQAAELARRAGAGELVLVHLSDRYDRARWLELLAEARAVFPATRFPERWEDDEGEPA
jgi:ribonuclease Z